jgi:hypothetical protein
LDEFPAVAMDEAEVVAFGDEVIVWH